MLLYHKNANQAMREELEAWVECRVWRTSTHLGWAAYRATKNCRLAALDRCPGTRPVGIALVWDRVMCKCALSGTGCPRWTHIQMNSVQIFIFILLDSFHIVFEE